MGETEVFHIIEGTGVMTVGDRTFELGPGDTLTTEPNELLNAINRSNTSFKYVVFKANVTKGDSYWSAEEG